MTAADVGLHMRAGALCITAEPHRDADEDLPCSGCLLRAASQQSIPSAHVSAPASSVTDGTPAPIGALDGASGRVPGASPANGQDGGSTLHSSPPRVSDTRGGGMGHRYGPGGA